ncbi:DnaJ domain-containing protein [Coprinopsis marcescibilis]|uniref:DnaJ domain-containing protein n=1 Tax=Coprinopsis marcescibilis TaxID=230819 RepID=A0A5C3KK20_COPMA|nr:DnaJ domain-containing protein [Coprinopsis marcescibilis]
MPPKKSKSAAKKKGSTPTANGAAAQAAAGSSTSPDGNSASSSREESTIPSPPQTPAPAERDPVKEAEKIKVQGNAKFTAKQYDDAVELYNEAIELNPQEPSYLTNRAAAYMALKRFRPALTDCQQALNILAPGGSIPSSSSDAALTTALVKTLFRLARCQFGLGETTAAMSSLSRLFGLEPRNVLATQLKHKIEGLQGHIKNFENAREKKEWGMARLSLDKCLQVIDAEGGQVPDEWRVWRVELELARANWDSAGIAANDALRLAPNSSDALALRGLVLFLTGKLPQALQHLQSALRFDPGHDKAQKLRKRVKDVERLKEEGNVAFKSNDLDVAVERYSEALERIGANPEEGFGGQIRATLLSNRATTLLKLSRHEDALTDTEESLKLFPHSFKALRTRARLHLHLEQYDACLADFKSAIEEAENEGSATEADVRALRAELKKAEAALKRSKTKDYYKILGVDRECSEAEIKKGYRRESLKHHPDKGGDEEKFKLVVEAHAVLSDPQKRRLYDMGEDVDGSSASDHMGGFSGGGGMGGMSHVDLADLFAQFHGGGGGGFGGFPGAAGGGRRGHGHGGFGF